ncbi:uncharacterized protein PFL1_03869 [Pseudozyma flocculosa PF-1]|uniref:Disintegrin and metalloproteinase domain-containing protein B n=2 Tax=Pseudozyma flocculosa TaxID=84751 RepID=A0A5C3EZT7_9BASI|nr:uncharacterized protein PFL1_03869 [Pseudozyma flocculosa PF-1]EPQ28565.1 hypothetical protein PFL1_03869 [Pseudozyma flocculosa PF-1]SPO36501.1 related to ADAM protease ADM-B [Pseudozyma flocculosa]
MQACRSLRLAAQAVLIASLVLFATLASAHSQRPRPLQRISHATDVRLEIIERQENLASRLTDHARRGSASNNAPKRRSPATVVPTDSLRLSLRAFSQQFYIHLQPNDDLLHPDGALVHYYEYNETSGRSYVRKTERLHNHDVRAYHGVVVHASHTDRRFEEDRAGVRRDIYGDRDLGVVGRASILVHDDGSESGTPKVEGSFDWMGNQHTIATSRNYHRKRSDGDPALERRHLEADSLILHRDSDIMTERDALEAGIESVEVASRQGCSSDGLSYNNQSHLILSDAFNDEMSRSAFSFFAKPSPAKFARRDLFGGVAGWFGRSDVEARTQDELVGRSEDAERRYVYDFDYLTPDGATFGRRQATGNDIGNGGNATNSYEDSIGSTAGCPSSPRVVYVGVASDCTYTQRLEGEEGARTEILNNMNSASNLYRSTFNVSLGVVQLDVRSGACPSSTPSDAPWNVACSASNNIDDRLSAFSQWRGQQPANGVGLWHLMTTCNSGSEIGVAWLGTLCMTDTSGSSGQYVSGTGVSSITPQQWQVMAHEMGHNFGAIHDCTQGCSLTDGYAVANGGATCCPLSTTTCDAGADHIMNPSSQNNIQSFSQCSIGNICSMLGRGLDTSCVETPGRRTTLSTQQCGNGILEPGEECDAGPNGSRCCTSQCKLTSGSQCDPETSPCCTSQCNYAPATQVCRPALDSRCDTAETCNGTSAECPADEKKSDGSSCGDGLSCANGLCTSRDLQCRQASTGSMSFSRACSASNANGCSLTCQDPSTANRCLILQQTFVDGTSCGNGGRCEDGQCKSGSWQDTFRGWYTNNLRISIPVTIVIAIIVLAILGALLRCCCTGFSRGGKGYKKANRTNAPVSAGPPPGAAPYYNNVGRDANGTDPSVHTSVNSSNAPQPPARYSSTAPGHGARRSSRPPSHSHSHWVDPSAYNGAHPPSAFPYNGGGGMPQPQASFAPPAGPPPSANYYESYGGGGGGGGGR